MSAEHTAVDTLGATLRRERELRQVSLEELVQQTRIPMGTLQCIEDDRFDELPGEVFVRGFIRSYATALGMDAAAVVQRYDSEQAREEVGPTPLNTIVPADRGRRFGIAIAVVILVILFTLALSIVLRPRHRERPLELSGVTPTLELPARPIECVERRRAG